MFSVVKLVDLAPGTDADGFLAKLRGIDTGADRTLIQPTLPGVRNGGDVLMHLRFADENGWFAVQAEFDDILAGAAVRHVNGATFFGAPIVTHPEQPATVHRTLLLRVHPQTPNRTVAEFENDLRLLAGYVTPISSWQLSRVDTAVGASTWTHVFEQQFRDLSGLTGPYLMHPIHWGYVDRWFDPECPDVIVRDRVCHSFCRSDMTS